MQIDAENDIKNIRNEKDIIEKKYYNFSSPVWKRKS